MKRRSEPTDPLRSAAVLGIDPGSQATGWGVVCGPSSAPRLVAAGVIRLPSGLAFAPRLHLLQVKLAEVVERHAPGSAGVEAPFHGASARAALQLAHARGVTLAVLAGASVEVFEYSPATVKKSVTGNGRAGKQQVARMVRSLLGGPPQALAELDGLQAGDRADALAVALCHLASCGRDRLHKPLTRRRAAGGEVVNLIPLRR